MLLVHLSTFHSMAVEVLALYYDSKLDQNRKTKRVIH
jgi:hypothetical protein